MNRPLRIVLTSSYFGGVSTDLLKVRAELSNRTDGFFLLLLHNSDPWVAANRERLLVEEGVLAEQQP